MPGFKSDNDSPCKVLLSQCDEKNGMLSKKKKKKF